MLRSPWLGVLAILIAGVVGYVLSDQHAGERTLASVTVSIRATRDSGAAWDFGGGMPDPKVTVAQGERVLARCEAKDTLQPTCAVNAALEGTAPVRVSVVDADSSDDDTIGELVLDLSEPTTTGTGAVQSAVAVLSGGGGAWQRFRALWIALAIGLAIAAALAVHRRRAR